MNISNVQNTKIQSFSSRKLFNISLLQKNALPSPKVIKGYISELEPDDLKRFDVPDDSWDFCVYGHDIINDFKKKVANIKFLPKYWGKKYFYSVEIPEINGRNKIISLTEATDEETNIRLNLIQSADNLESQDKIYGGGSGLLYVIERLAEKIKRTRITLDADENAIGFYKKNGFSNPYDNYCSLSSDKFAHLKNRLEQEYCITPFVSK